MNTSQDFAGKAVVVTGAAGGVGRATALSFAALGADVFATDVNADGLADLAAAAEADGNSVQTLHHDLIGRDNCHAVINAAVEALGRLDVLANVAGVLSTEHSTAVSEADWDLTLAVNTSAPFFLCQAAIPHLLEAEGNIVNVASSAGKIGQAYTVAYAASKGAVIQITKSLAMEYVKTPLRVNAICPGGMVTGMTENFSLPDDVDFDLIMRYAGFRGMAEPQTAANAIIWLASEAAARCTGTILSVDGGITAG